ncbi:hypothetical protein HBA54_08195 [Pelagibius litoralis]|uniref:Stringent starvation protein B n=1 Tax=Pelagibius litoralis TaxID=374515 RepID=A0A967EVW8_9PROT|nr:ClpXP protease specificity-enhancing factor SspB [Pelagibius litoralis]NIA68569.1 hypothetical protein [Pelagibius litoralis]
MAKEELRYDRMVEDALRSVVRRALVYVSEQGLPGNHHFYITFRTEHAGVDIPKALKERYPGEMTIVLQHQFWGLEISEKQFAVTLSFADVPHRLVVPFDSVTAFADPSVRFGLQFDVESLDGSKSPSETGDPAALPEGAQAGLAEPPRLAGNTESGTPPSPSEDGEKSDAAESAEKVVTLDAFRKK